MLFASVTILPYSAIIQLNKIHKSFFWNHKKPKTKEKATINNFEKGGLKGLEILSKITSMQCSWVTKLFDTNFHE